MLSNLPVRGVNGKRGDIASSTLSEYYILASGIQETLESPAPGVCTPADESETTKAAYLTNIAGRRKEMAKKARKKIDLGLGTPANPSEAFEVLEPDEESLLGSRRRVNTRHEEETFQDLVDFLSEG